MLGFDYPNFRAKLIEATVQRFLIQSQLAGWVSVDLSCRTPSEMDVHREYVRDA